MVKRTVIKAWEFSSDSNPSKSYQTLLYDDKTVSCNCPGWTRRVDAKGNRACKHTRMVEFGTADRHAEAIQNYNTVPVVDAVTNAVAALAPASGSTTKIKPRNSERKLAI